MDSSGGRGAASFLRLGAAAGGTGAAKPNGFVGSARGVAIDLVGFGRGSMIRVVFASASGMPSTPTMEIRSSERPTMLAGIFALSVGNALSGIAQEPGP